MDVDLQSWRALVRTAIPSMAGVLLALHTTTGVRTFWNEPEPHRDWVMTKIWSFCMDAICVGLILSGAQLFVHVVPAQTEAPARFDST